MQTFTVTQKQVDRKFSYALGQLLGQKSDGSVDDFSIITTANLGDDGEFLGTYQIEIPDGRSTTVEIQALLDDPNPEQAPVVPMRIHILRDVMVAGNPTLAEVAEYIKLRDGLT